MIFLPTIPNIRYSWGLLAQLVHGLPLEMMTFEALGFHAGDPETVARLERVSRSALHAYNMAIGESDPERLGMLLELIDPELSGFAEEGVGLGLMILDICAPWKESRVFGFIEARKARPDLIYIGAGQALSALFRPLEPTMEKADPLYRGLFVDGFGFHRSVFRIEKTVRRHEVPGSIGASLLPDFDVGVGRALWFIECATPDRIAETVGAFPEARRPDLWTGVGFAAAYAGGVRRRVLEALAEAAGERRPELAHGAAVAVHTREKYGHAASHVQLAADALCARTVAELFALGEAARAEVQAGDDTPRLGQWRERLKRKL